MKNSKSKRQNSIRQLAGKIMREMLEMRETFEALNIIRLKRFKPQAIQTSSDSNLKRFKPQALRQILIFIRMTLSSEPVLNLIQE